jgi:hypothetical protein
MNAKRTATLTKTRVKEGVSVACCVERGPKNEGLTLGFDLQVQRAGRASSIKEVERGLESKRRPRGRGRAEERVLESKTRF